MDQHLNRRRKWLLSADNFAPASWFRDFDIRHAVSMTQQECAKPTTAWNDVVCKCDAGKSSSAVAWVEKFWRNYFGPSLKRGLPKQSFPERKLDVNYSSDRISFKRRHRPRAKKDMSSLETNLLFLMSKDNLTSSKEDSIHYDCCSFSSVQESPKGPEVDYLPMGLFLQPYLIDSFKLVQKLTLEKQRPSLCKQSSLGFARLQGEPHIMASMRSQSLEASEIAPGALPSRLNGVPLLNLLESIPQIKICQQQPRSPDKETLSSMQDFFLYIEREGRQVFEELDSDKDGKVTYDDLKVATGRMKLPPCYAKKFMQRTHSKWLVKSLGWSEFSSVMYEKEPVMIRLFNSLGVSKSGTLRRNHVKVLLQKAGFPETEGNVIAMLKLLGADTGYSIKYSQFRRFMLLVPTDQLLSDPWNVWCNAAISADKPSNQVFQDAVRTSAKGLLNQLVKSLKDGTATPNLPRAEDVSESLRLSVKCMIHDPISRMGVELLDIGGSLLSNAELQIFSSSKMNLARLVRKNRDLHFNCLDEVKQNAAEQPFLEVGQSLEAPSYESR